jgi:hypothetical protein
MIKSALILVFCVSPLLAQTERRAALGDRVRIEAARAGYGRLTGQVTATTPDAIQVLLQNGTEVAVMRQQIDRMFLSLRARRNTTRGAVLGALLVGSGTFLFGPKKVSATQPQGAGKVPATNVVSATIAGAGVGALIGYYTRSDTWLALSPRP